ncbi:MAG: Rha family transcriptional regulator [Romboutsia sp.]
MDNQIITNENVAVLDSREVAEMVEMRHGDLLRKIDEVNKDFNECKIASVEYWKEETYKDAKGEERRCLKITKRGCGFIAHKTTGTKGNIFTHKYMEKFEEMEKHLHGDLVPADKLQNIITDAVTKEISRLRTEHSEYIKPLSADKYRITKYIKDRLEIAKANEEFELVKERVLMQLGAEKWEDVPVETLLTSLNLIDESIKVIKADRKENQVSWF